MIRNSVLSVILFTFFVQVKIPAGISRTYENVKEIRFMDDGVTIRLTLHDDKIAYVPAFFTIIEER